MLGSGRSMARNGHLPPAPQPSYPAPHSLFRVLGSAHEKPDGYLAKSG